ncbi:hypothetical protein ACPRNU_21340 [Chromobacterium vaccinii]|uniref:hypothetical protein n=1 Tax=Chromobacterium vaccinii TaxID=1108595 RepID=UPI003C778158
MQHSQVDRDVVNDIFRSLRGRFGNAFVDKFRSGERVPKDQGLPYEGMDIGLLEAIDVWVHELRNLSPADIRHGLESKFRYPPSADEFVLACCTREITPPTPTLTDEAQRKLAAPAITREQAEVHIATVARVAKSMSMPQNNRHRLDWAYTIAKEINRGVSTAPAYARRCAAEALFNARQSLPAELVPYLPESKTNPMEDAA